MRWALMLRRVIPPTVLRLFEGFWALPMALTLGGLGGVALVQTTDPAPFLAIVRVDAGAADADGLRSALGAIAGAVLTVASLVFSLTFVALSMTAQQLSPRLLDDVLRVRATQWLLGLALASFLFAAGSLAIGESNGTERLVLAVPVALSLATLTLITVPVFAFQISRVMRAEEMVSRLGDSYMAALRDAADGPPGCQPGDAAGGPAERLADALAGAPEVAADATGYVGVIDHAAILDWAAAEDLLVELLVAENDFLLTGEPAARIAGLHVDPGDTDVARRLTKCLNLTDRRVASGAAEYEAAALCEAALRALSPGINDPATARSCINRLVQGFARLLEAGDPPHLLADASGHTRLRRQVHGLDRLVRTTMMPIADAAEDAATLAHLADLTERLMAVSGSRPAVLSELAAAIARKRRAQAQPA